MCCFKPKNLIKDTTTFYCSLFFSEIAVDIFCWITTITAVKNTVLISSDSYTPRNGVWNPHTVSSLESRSAVPMTRRCVYVICARTLKETSGRQALKINDLTLRSRPPTTVVVLYFVRRNSRCIPCCLLGSRHNTFVSFSTLRPFPVGHI